MAIQTLKRKITVNEFQLMAKTGILDEKERLELMEGEIITMTPIGDNHARCVLFLTNFFAKKLIGKVMINVQNPLQLDTISQSQPDITLLRPRSDYYQSKSINPDDILLLIEVADSSIKYDRQIKAPFYAKHGISELWIINLENQTVEIYRDPQSDGYKDCHTFHPGDKIAPKAFPAFSMSVKDILG